MSSAQAPQYPPPLAPTPATIPDEEEAAPHTGFGGSLLGAVLALAVAVLALRLLTQDTSQAPPRAQGTPPPLRDLATAPVAPPARAAPVIHPVRPEATPQRTDFASITDAGERLGMRVWRPTVLPDGFVPLYIAWQPDSFVAVPEQRPPGVLRAWYWHMDHGAGLLIEQGPGVRVVTRGAPPSEHGTVTLPDGREIVWVRGHPAMPDDPANNTVIWTGNEVRVGLVTQGARTSWRLISAVLPLEALLRVAESMELVE